MRKPFPKHKIRINNPGLAMGLFVLIFVLLLVCGAVFAETAEPVTEDLPSVSRVDDSILLLRCEAEYNDKVYAPIPVGVMSVKENETETEPDEQEEPPEEQPLEEKQPEIKEKPKRPQEKPQTEKPSATGDLNSNVTPSENETGGTGGGDSENGLKDSIVYFTTSIKDGETVTDPVYSFTITHKLPALKVESLMVYLNDAPLSRFNGKVELREGSNKIRIAVQYRDGDGKLLPAVYKDYIVNLDSTSLVINTSLVNGHVTSELFDFTASASYLGKAADLQITVNGASLNTTADGKYQIRLKDGANVFVLTAAGGNLSRQLTYTVTYDNDGVFEIFTNLTDCTVTTDTISFRAWIRNGSSQSRIVAKVNGNNITADGDTYSPSLQFGENIITVVGVDGDKRCETKTYKVIFERPVASEDDPIPDKDHAPVVSFNFEDGATVASQRFTLKISAQSYKGDVLYSDRLAVTLNGVVLSCIGDGSVISYIMDLQEGANTVTVTATDNEGYSCFLNRTIIYAPTEGAVGHATISIEALVLGLGYIIEPTQVEIYNNENLGQALSDLLAEKNTSMDYSGTFDNSFYLRRIVKDGLLNNYAVPAELQVYLESENQTMEPDDLNSLGEKDFYSGSGWMIAINGEYINYGIDRVTLMDGDVCCLRFTLAMGKDIGGADGNYPISYIMGQ